MVIGSNVKITDGSLLFPNEKSLTKNVSKQNSLYGRVYNVTSDLCFFPRVKVSNLKNGIHVSMSSFRFQSLFFTFVHIFCQRLRKTIYVLYSMYITYIWKLISMINLYYIPNCMLLINMYFICHEISSVFCQIFCRFFVLV